jgi:adenylylsulfate kinase
MRLLSDGVSMAGKIAVTDFVCPFAETRNAFDPDYTIWMDTIQEGRFEDTNKIFQKPRHCDYHVTEWYANTHLELEPVINMAYQKWLKK